MAHIELLDDPEFAAQDSNALGYTPNFNRLYARRPEVYAAWRDLNRAIKSSMELRRYELATIAAARELRSEYCTLAHGKVLRDKLDIDVDTSELTETDRAVMRFATKVIDDATSITKADVDELRAVGLDDDDIFDVVLTASARAFFSSTLSALAVEPDEQLAPVG